MSEREPQPRASAADAAEPTADELLDLLRQERADFLNYRRRVSEERAADEDRARGQVMEPLFPLLDDLSRAFADVPPGLESDPWAQGIGLLRSRLLTTLANLGLEPVGAVGEPFDPTRHDAILHEPDPHASGQHVSHVIRPGYRVGGRLLRPAEVVVRGPVAGDASGSDDNDGDQPSGEVRRPRPIATGNPDDDQPVGG